ncbi:MAG: ATP--guanido phosphotransferase [Desulfitibacter sp. BRH_c19]|nr:MAG: ATP--guanido phosphotransferase [Desulfitibacter sp. BRH_c19]
MHKEKLISLEEKWIAGEGQYSDVVVSTRIRLARNLIDLPFPHLMKQEDIDIQFNMIEKTIEAIEPKLDFWLLKDLNSLEKRILVEKHLISPEHADSGKGAVLINENRSISIMVIEEDHLRIQAILPGLDLFEAYKIADQIDDLMEEKLDIAFNEKYGFLTSCPTNVGTGLRASVMLHLPGLVLTKQASRILSALSQVGVVVRGIYGEGTEAVGNLFQISNQITIGRSEDEIINNLYSVVLKIIDQEKAARELLAREIEPILSDKVCRAYGILTNARVITSEEALSLLSDMKLGIDLKILEGIDPTIFTKAMVSMQPAYLQYSMGKEMSPMERDINRSQIIRDLLRR